MHHAEHKALLSVHALSTLDREDARALDEHLARCAECRAELDAWQATADALVYAAQPLEPSPQLRDRILAGIRKDFGKSQADNVVPISRAGRQQARRQVWFPEGVRAFQATAAAVILLGLIVGLV